MPRLRRSPSPNAPSSTGTSRDSTSRQLELFHGPRDGVHGARGAQLTRPRPRHAAPRTRGAHLQSLESIGASGATCGRSTVTDHPGTSLGFDVPDTACPLVTEPQLVTPAPSIDRMLGGATIGDGMLGRQVETRTMTRGIVQIPRVASHAMTAGPELNSTRNAVSAIASYVFVVALIACTFLV